MNDDLYPEYRKVAESYPLEFARSGEEVTDLIARASTMIEESMCCGDEADMYRAGAVIATIFWLTERTMPDPIDTRSLLVPGEP